MQIASDKQKNNLLPETELSATKAFSGAFSWMKSDVCWIKYGREGELESGCELLPSPELPIMAVETVWF